MHHPCVRGTPIGHIQEIQHNSKRSLAQSLACTLATALTCHKSITYSKHHFCGVFGHSVSPLCPGRNVNPSEAWRETDVPVSRCFWSRRHGGNGPGCFGTRIRGSGCGRNKWRCTVSDYRLSCILMCWKSRKIRVKVTYESRVRREKHPYCSALILSSKSPVVTRLGGTELQPGAEWTQPMLDARQCGLWH